MDLAALTFVVLTRNEARNLGECLASIPADARVLIYDAESTDATLRIARERGAQIAVQAWRGFAIARDAAEQLVTTEWLFILDADERVTQELRTELQELQPSDGIDAYEVPRANYFCGRWIRGAAWWPDRQVRMYRKGRARQTARGARSLAAGHVYYVAPGRTAVLRGRLIHHSYESIDDYRRRFKQYTDLEASAGPASFGDLVVSWLVMPLRAGWLLLWRRGLLDGWRGIYVSIASALYPAVVVTKAWRAGAGGRAA
jgi:glycosyltransferase involved in cell wall biosynthesis